MVDHVSIYLLLAGTYTPILLITVGGTFGWIFFAIQWSLALLGIILKVRYFHRFQNMAVVMYAAMGWVGILKINHLMAVLPSTGLWLLLSGGLFYTIGIIFYQLGFKVTYAHFIWHLFVIAGSFSHFISIFFYVIPS